MELRTHAATIPLEPHWIFSYGINPLVVSIHGCISIDFAIKNSATREPLDGGKDKTLEITDISVIWFYGYIGYIGGYFGKKISINVKLIKIYKSIRKTS